MTEGREEPNLASHALSLNPIYTNCGRSHDRLGHAQLGGSQLYKVYSVPVTGGMLHCVDKRPLESKGMVRKADASMLEYHELRYSK